MRALVLLVAFGLLLGGDGEKTYKLDMLPKPAKGQEEKVEIEASFSRPKDGEVVSDSMTGTLKRTIKSLGEDGLSLREELTLEGAQFKHERQSEHGGSSSTHGLWGTWTQTLKRDNKARSANDLAVPSGMEAVLMPVLRRDPDAIARAVLPDEPVAKGEEWELDPKDLLRILAPYRSKLAERSKAKATLESVKKGEALVTFEATLRYTTPDDPDTELRMSIEGSLRGAIDGSVPPRKETLTISQKVKGVKETFTQTLQRSWVEKEEDAEKKDEKKKEPAEKEK